MTKRQKTLTLVFGVILTLSVIGVTSAYFLVARNTSGNTGIVDVTTTELANLTLTSIKSAAGNPLYPGWVGYQGVEVHATGSGSTIYDLTLTVTTGSNIKSDVNVAICKVENSTTALAAGDFTYTQASAQVNTSTNPVQYYMSGGNVALPSTCTEVLATSTLSTLGTSYQISAARGKELAANKYDKYYITYVYQNKNSSQVQGETFTVTPSISTKAEKDLPSITCETTLDSGTYAACNASSMTVGQRVKISADGQPDQYFRYIRTTDNEVTSLNECADGAESSACSDTNANGKVGIPGAGYIRLLAEYNLNVGDNQYKVNNVVVNDGIQDEHVYGYKNGYTMYGNIAYGSSSSKSSYAGSVVKAYIEAYASILNTRYGINAPGSAITKAELENLGCSGSSCSGAPSWVYNTSYWSGSARARNDAWSVYSNASFSDTECDMPSDLGVRPVIQIATSNL